MNSTVLAGWATAPMPLTDQLSLDSGTLFHNNLAAEYRAEC
ncbi:hypothetical protein [Nonomuraea sp. NPDC050691]